MTLKQKRRLLRQDLAMSNSDTEGEKEDEDQGEPTASVCGDGEPDEKDLFENAHEEPESPNIS